MALFERTPSRGGSRFGKLSSNMFFTRNTAKPKRVRHLEGLNGALICNVNDDPASVGATSSSPLGLNPVNLPSMDTPRRIERLVPPTGFWNTFGVIHDTDRWRKELASLAVASGLGVENEDYKHSTKPTTTTTEQQHLSRSGAHYSNRTGRFNEGTSKSRGRTSSKHATAHSEMLFQVPENERDMWMLQVLCQLLGTSNLEDVQSWLVSASQTERDQARAMITSALQGLKESERASEQVQQSVDLNSLNNFVEKRKNDEKKATHKYVQESLNRPIPVLHSIDEEQQQQQHQFDAPPEDSWTHLGNENVPPSNNATTYKRAFQNFTRRSFSSLGSRSGAKNDQSNDEPFNQRRDNGNDEDEQIDTIQLDDDRQRPRSAALTHAKKSQESLPPPPSSHKQRHRVESIQFNDDDNKNNNIDDLEDRPRPRKDATPPVKVKQQVDDDDDNSKSRKIRQLRNKLSRQEEESKKLFEELQSKQSRLENAIKLLVKQTSTYQTRGQKTRQDDENADAPIVNVIIQSPRPNNREDKQQESNSSSGNKRDSSPPTAAINGKFKKSMNKNQSDNGVKPGDYTIQDVKVQIRLSRLDNRPGKVFSGIWKPDASTLHRLQSN